MFIKFESGNKWVLFGNVDHVEYMPLGNCDASCCGEDGIMVYPQSINSPVVEPEMELIISRGNILQKVLAHSPIYIMNDSGKTIEVI